jgi:hypothetical protein
MSFCYSPEYGLTNTGNINTILSLDGLTLAKQKLACFCCIANPAQAIIQRDFAQRRMLENWDFSVDHAHDFSYLDGKRFSAHSSSKTMKAKAAPVPTREQPTFVRKLPGPTLATTKTFSTNNAKKQEICVLKAM